jgi:hypothetical protein
MPRFQPKSAPRAELEEPKGERADLAEAIAAATAAEATVHELETAESASFERKMEAERKLESLKEREHQDDGAADAFIASMRGGGGGDCLIDTIDAPSKRRAAEIETAEREVAMLARVRAEIADRIPIAREDLDRARAKVATVAKAILAAALDPDALIAAGERAYRQLADATARIRFAASLLPYNSPEGQRLSLWPETHFRNVSTYGDYRLDPANAYLAKALEALMRGEVDALDIAP